MIRQLPRRYLSQRSVRLVQEIRARAHQLREQDRYIVLRREPIAITGVLTIDLEANPEAPSAA